MNIRQCFINEKCKSSKNASYGETRYFLIRNCNYAVLHEAKGIFIQQENYRVNTR